MKLVSSLLFLTTACIASAATTSELLDQIQTDARAEVKESKKSKDHLAEHSAQLLEGLILSFDDAKAETRGISLLSWVEQVEMAAYSDPLQELCHKTAQQIRAERQQRGAALAEEARTSFATVLKNALTAKEAKALDTPLVQAQELEAKIHGDYLGNPELSTLLTQGESLIAFLRRWQEYLAGVGSNNSPRSYFNLRNLLDARSDFSAFMPRSELLARIKEIEDTHKEKAEKVAEAPPKPVSSSELSEQVQAIVMSIHDFPGLDEAVPKLEALRSKFTTPGSTQSLDNILDNLRFLQRAHLDLSQGLATNLPVTFTNYSSQAVSNTIYDLREQLLLTALPRLLDVKGDDALPQPGENAPTYLLRTAEGALKKDNWPLLKRTIEVALSLNIGIAATVSDRSALQFFVAGVDQEEARQYATAVGSYLNALRAGSQMISPALIGDHLDGLRKNHPQEYAEGVQLDQKPKMSDPREVQAWMRTRSYGAQAPDPGSVPPVVLTVPASRQK